MTVKTIAIVALTAITFAFVSDTSAQQRNVSNTYLRAQAIDAMQRATTYFHETVATHGG